MSGALPFSSADHDSAYNEAIQNELLMVNLDREVVGAHVTSVSTTIVGTTTNYLNTFGPETSTALSTIESTSVPASTDYYVNIFPRALSSNPSQNAMTIRNNPANNETRVGINLTDPEETLEVDGSIQIDSANTSRLKFQKSGPSPHALGEIDGEEDGSNGGDLQFYTKVDGGSVTEKLRINNAGAIGLGGATYGTSGQVLTSAGNSAIPTWTTLNSKVYASATLTADITGVSSGSTIIGASTGLTDRLASSTAGVIQSGVTYSGFKAPRDGIYNISIITYVIATIGGVEAHTQLRNASSTSTTTMIKNAFYTTGTSAYSLTNSTVLKMAQNEVVYVEVFGPNPFTVRGDTSTPSETRISFFNVD